MNRPFPNESHSYPALPASDEWTAVMERLRSLQENPEPLNPESFSWRSCREFLKDFKGNFSDLLEEERNA